jgi:hypothetical protein
VTQKFTLLETEKRNMQNDALSKLDTRLRGNIMTPGSGVYWRHEKSHAVGRQATTNYNSSGADSGAAA